jgi:uncharacterized metal-binding protein YceD (DUF177 family)
MGEKRQRVKPRPPERAPGQPWRIPVLQTEVPATGLHVDLAADAKVRADIARLAGLTAVPRLEASFDVTRHGRSGLHVIGRVSATVGQICGVTLEPIENEIDEAVELLFVPAPAAVRGQHGWKEVEVRLDDASEPLIDGTIDLGAVATESLILGIDPYPRKPGIAFQAPNTAERSARPFAALAALKKRRG